MLDVNKSAKSVSTAVRLVCNAATSAAVAVVAIAASIASTSACNAAKDAERPERSIALAAALAEVAAFWAAVIPDWRPLIVPEREETCPDKADKPSTWDLRALICAFKSSNWSS